MSKDLLGPLPEFATEFRPRWPGDVGGFTAAQMRAYAADAVAAAIERCARPLEDSAARLLAPKRTNNGDRHTASVLQDHAARMRSTK